MGYPHELTRRIPDRTSKEMPTITLLASVHAENGRCSADELCRILEQLAPDVLFQEVPHFEFQRKREEALRHPARDFRLPVRPLPLEILAVTQYLTRHTLTQIPVDPLGQSGTDNRKHDEVADWVLRSGPELRADCDWSQRHEARHGFAYLNSRQFLRAARRRDQIFLNALQAHPNPRLSEYYADWKDYNARRETSMIQNIIEYAASHTFETAVFLFGAAHREGLIRQIQKAKRHAPVPLMWKLYHG